MDLRQAIIVEQTRLSERNMLVEFGLHPGGFSAKVTAVRPGTQDIFTQSSVLNWDEFFVMDDPGKAVGILVHETAAVVTRQMKDSAP